MRRALFLAWIALFAPACRSADGATAAPGLGAGQAALSLTTSPLLFPVGTGAADAPLLPSPSTLTSPSPSGALPLDPPPTSPPLPPKPIAIGKGTRVLVIGDSMAPPFSLHLKDIVERAGGKFARDYWPGSTTVAWVHLGRLRKALHKHKPDVVFVVLGSNEVFSPYPEKLAPHMRELARRLAPRACAWIGPPLWPAARRRGKAILALQRENAAPCAYFDSAKLDLARWKEDIHPTPEGGRVWLDAAMRELVEVDGQKGTRLP